jgi:hypothetical protein
LGQCPGVKLAGRVGKLSEAALKQHGIPSVFWAKLLAL